MAEGFPAKEITYLRDFVKDTHAGKKILAVDAAVGGAGDVGLIKINNGALLPGAGANKKLGAIGNISVMGIVAEKSVNNFGLLNSTRFHLVYTMAEIISEGVAAVLWELYGNRNSSGGNIRGA